MSRGNNQRPGAGASVFGTPPTGYNVNMALSRAQNEVHYLKRQVSNFVAQAEAAKYNWFHQLKGKDLAYEKMVSKYKKKFSDLTRENKGLSLKLRETTEQLAVKSAELTVNNETWQQKYEDLEKKTSKELDYQQQSLESNVTGLLSTNASLPEKLHKQQADNHQLEAEHELLKTKTEALAETIRENEGLSLKLTETTEQLSVKSAELRVNNQTWQQKYEDLEKKTSKELDYQQQSLKSEVTGLLSTNVSLLEELHKQQTNNRQLVAEHKLLKTKTEALAETIRENEGLSLKLTETTEQLSVKSAELTVNYQTCQQLEAEHKLLKIERDSLAASQKSLKQSYHEMVTKSELCQYSKIQQMEVNQNLIARIQDLEDDKTVLENICLDFKKKKRGIFGRRMQDRETEMDKMRRKMQNKETKKQKREEKKKETIQDVNINVPETGHQ
ncbi:uncharacterized protein LOC144411584 [Gasterosteus aculeatus]